MDKYRCTIKSYFAIYRTLTLYVKSHQNFQFNNFNGEEIQTSRNN